ncbi:MAG: hypothetical protein M3451_07905, partial [Chloroflexota bacterium]|nr:hypothetical protein [Chloroflexota bacterium]
SVIRSSDDPLEMTMMVDATMLPVSGTGRFAGERRLPMQHRGKVAAFFVLAARTAHPGLPTI